MTLDKPLFDIMRETAYEVTHNLRTENIDDIGRHLWRIVDVTMDNPPLQAVHDLLLGQNFGKPMTVKLSSKFTKMTKTVINRKIRIAKNQHNEKDIEDELNALLPWLNAHADKNLYNKSDTWESGYESAVHDIYKRLRYILSKSEKLSNTH